MATRDEYLNNVAENNIIAFRMGDSVFSGKVISVDYEKPNPFVVKTNNGSVYFVSKQDVMWIKNGSKWPVGIYNALRYQNEVIKNGSERK